MAVRAAVAADCAARAGGFWQMHDLLFRRSGHLTEQYLADTSSNPGVPGDSPLSCPTAEVETMIRRQLAEARSLQVVATPTFFVGLNTKDGVIFRHRGSGPSLQPLIGMIDATLSVSGSAR